MNSRTLDSLLAAVSSGLQPATAQLLATAVHSIPNNGTSSPSSVILQAISNLKSSNKITNTQALSLQEAVMVAKVSNDNSSLIKAIDNNNAENSLRDFDVKFDTSKLLNAAQPFNIKPPTNGQIAPIPVIDNKLSNAEPTAPVVQPPDGDQVPSTDPALNDGTGSTLPDGTTPDDNGLPASEADTQGTGDSPAAA